MGDQIVNIIVNGKKSNYDMKLSNEGVGFFSYYPEHSDDGPGEKDSEGAFSSEEDANTEGRTPETGNIG